MALANTMHIGYFESIWDFWNEFMDDHEKDLIQDWVRDHALKEEDKTWDWRADEEDGIIDLLEVWGDSDYTFIEQVLKLIDGLWIFSYDNYAESFTVYKLLEN